MRARLAIGATIVAAVVGCSSGITRSTARTIEPGPTTTTVVQTGTSNGLYAVAGTYGLLSIDVYALPYGPPAKDASFVPTQIVSGTLTLNVNGTFAVATTYRTVDDRGERRFDGQFNGACARDGEGYRLFWDGGGESAVKASGDTLVIDREGLQYRYLKHR